MVFSSLIDIFPLVSLLHILLFISNIPSAFSDDPLYYVCSNDSNYTSNSPYKANLNLLLSNLSLHTSPTPASPTPPKASPGSSLHGMATCRGDITSTTCPECLNTSVHTIAKLCPRQKSAAIWFSECLLRYSNQNFFSIVDTSFKLYIQNDAQVPEPKRFSVLLGNLMDELATYAAFNSTRMFAFRAVDFTSSVKLYGLTQCTRDLSQRDCYSCLQRVIKNITSVGKQKVKGLSRSCVVGYEFSENLSPDTEGDAPAAPPSSSIPPVSSVPPKGTSTTGKSKTKAIAIVIPSVVGALLIFVICLCLWRWRARRVKSTLTITDDGDEPEEWRATVVIDLVTLKHATDNFSDESKLGQGGFGSVYKRVSFHCSGYMAPEYAIHGHFSTKSDVFSYGVLVLEIVTGRLNNSFKGSGRAANLLSYVWHNWNEKKALDLKDQSLGDEFQAVEVMRCIHVGLLCVQEDPALRPRMASVVLMLSNFTMSLPKPSTPAFLVQGYATSESETQ
ncbi:hypothetical protein J5N97_011557 [Dioscorea zingiberensis]|uniref:Gnk2-homologous domain-containing protein n=1 Tax=Dioscorea zingiberensis TaxID=325984 RepID=A0A9D5D2N4_9LILI|nr:hypothetical protein J5N97_011557 [Dioscorea zingiberensis]